VPLSALSTRSTYLNGADKVLLWMVPWGTSPVPISCTLILAAGHPVLAGSLIRAQKLWTEPWPKPLDTGFLCAVIGLPLWGGRGASERADEVTSQHRWVDHGRDDHRGHHRSGTAPVTEDGLATAPLRGALCAPARDTPRKMRAAHVYRGGG